jgi:hypothetical protein
MLKSLESEYDRILNSWQRLMESTTDEDLKAKLHIVGNRNHTLYENLKHEIMTGKKK